MKTKEPREVRIELMHGYYFVLYVVRKPRQRFCAAQFYAPDYTLESVEKWVGKKANLKLVEQ